MKKHKKQLVSLLIIGVCISIAVSYSDENNKNSIPKRLIEVDQIKGTNEYAITYDCMCGYRAIEISKKNATAKVFSICSEFNPKDNHETWPIEKIDRAGNGFKIKFKKTKQSKIIEMTLEPVNKTVFKASLVSEITHKPSFLIDYGKKSQFKIVRQECGDFDG